VKPKRRRVVVAYGNSTRLSEIRQSVYPQGDTSGMSTDLRKAARDAAVIALAEQGITTPYEAREALLAGLRRIPAQMQFFVDSIVGIQKNFPMPKAGWEQFIADLEYTNEKHGLNLHIKPELLEGSTDGS